MFRELEEIGTGLPAVAGEHLTVSIAEFYSRCLILIGEEQAKPNADAHLISVLCDAVRFTREHVYLVDTYLRAPLVTELDGGAEMPDKPSGSRLRTRSATTSSQNANASLSAPPHTGASDD